jgi:hypothetical protein
MRGEEVDSGDFSLDSDTGFLEEIIASLGSSDRESKKCAIEIISRFIDVGGDQAKRTLLDAGCLQGLLMAMDDTMGKIDGTGALAAKCFRELRNFEEVQLLGKNVKDHWDRIRREWDEEDKKNGERDNLKEMGLHNLSGKGRKGSTPAAGKSTSANTGTRFSVVKKETTGKNDKRKGAGNKGTNLKKPGPPKSSKKNVTFEMS